MNLEKTALTRTLSVVMAMIVTVLTFAIARPVTAHAATVDSDVVQIMAAQQQGGGDAAAGGGADAGDDVWNSVINTFVKWIKRLGFLVAFIGAVMFALGIKDSDADSKQRGVMTMVAGFLVAGLCIGVNMFHLF